MKKAWISGCAFAVLLGLATPSYADLSYGKYKELRNSRERDGITLYLRGIGEGIFWSNSLGVTKGKPIGCVPGKLVLGLENFRAMIEEGAKGLPEEEADKFSISMLMVLGFEKTFPCS